MAYAVIEHGKLLVNTVYEAPLLSKMHYLAFCTGDYAEEDFYMLPGRLSPDAEFEHYPQAHVVPVSVGLQVH